MNKLSDKALEMSLGIEPCWFTVSQMLRDCAEALDAKDRRYLQD